MQISGLEDKALKIAKALSEDFQGCKSHKDFPVVFREFTKKLKSLQQDLQEATVRKKLKTLTPDEIDFPSALSSTVKSSTSPEAKRGNFFDDQENIPMYETDHSNPFNDSLEQKIVFKPLALGESKKRKNKEVNAIARDVDTIAQTFDELNELVHDQEVGLDQIEENTFSARLKMVEAKKNILKASKYQSNLVYTIGGTVLGGLVGGPVGAVALGLKAGIGIGVGSSLIGGLLGHEKSKKENQRINDELRQPWNPQESHTELSASGSPKNIAISEQL